MPTRTGYKPGVPCWVDLASTDLTASVAFYEALFGWRAAFDTCGEAGVYGRFSQGGRLVAGIGPTFSPDRPSAWNTYFATGDAESATERVKEAGGRVAVGPVQVFDEGTMAVFQDPEGASFLVWEPVRHQGAQLVDEPVALCWSELACRDPEGARAFYGEVFGWSARTLTGPGGGDRAEWLLDGRPVAGLRTMNAVPSPPGRGTPSLGERVAPSPGGAPSVPEAGTPSVPEAGTRSVPEADTPPVPDRGAPSSPDAPHWLAVFAVAGCEATAVLAERCGGAVVSPPRDLPAGRHAVLADPCGAVFAVMAPSPPGGARPTLSASGESGPPPKGQVTPRG
ncbi:VOC family protein [Sphaerisporangium sp. NPDC005289]|uniref:VOC family protein n=1 Tax=Sphaerisporangium sp. NPDC005289 TaxID=3155247 RepID=UPI00339EE2CC